MGQRVMIGSGNGLASNWRQAIIFMKPYGVIGPQGDNKTEVSDGAHQ